MAINPRKLKTPTVTVPNKEVCKRLMSEITEGVLVLSRDNMPYAVPMNYIYHKNRIYFH